MNVRLYSVYLRLWQGWVRVRVGVRGYRVRVRVRVRVIGLGLRLGYLFVNFFGLIFVLYL